MFDLSRCRNFLTVWASLGFAVLVINFSLMAAAGPRPYWLVTEHDPMGWDFMDENDALVSGVLAESKKKKHGTERCFCVYIGKSTAHHAIDPEILEANDGSHCRYLGLWGQGEGMHDFDLLARPLFATDLKPNLALLCIHPAFLAGRSSERLDDLLYKIPPLTRDWRGVLGIIRRCNWIQEFRIRTFISHAIRTTLYTARIKIFDRLQLDADAFSTPDRSPWRPRYPAGTQARDPEDQVAKRFHAYEALGWFDLKQYEKYREPISDVLVDVIKTFRARGTEAIIVLMPETARVRERVPPEARRYLEADLAKAFPGAGLTLLDFQRVLPDSMFLDDVHPSSAGRKEFSLSLARAIKEHLVKRGQAGQR